MSNKVAIAGCTIALAGGLWWVLRPAAEVSTASGPIDELEEPSREPLSAESAEAETELESGRESPVLESSAPPAPPGITGDSGSAAQEPLRFTGRLIELPTNHIPPDASIFEEKYAGLGLTELQRSFSDLTRTLASRVNDAFAVERATGREIVMPAPIMDDPTSPDHGRMVFTCPYANRISRVGPLPGDPKMMTMMLLDPASYSDLYDVSAECAWLSNKVHSLGGKPAMLW